MTAELMRISFESVSAISHPEYYDWRTERVRRDLDHSTVPEEHWHETHRDGEAGGIRDQLTGLRQLIAEGELIRNVRVFRLEHVVTEVTEIEP